jgi:enoyl-CoA hydratase/carnithine racemase
MMSDLVLLTVDGPVATITLNRAEKRNAIAPSMLAELDAMLSEVEASDSIRVLIVTGAGDRAFCAGADITAWSELAPIDMWRRWIPAGQRVLDHLEGLRQPTIAAINGLAFGGGLELALACDLRIATDHAAFAAPEVGIATVPGWGATGRLATVVGLARAKQLILTGQPIDAPTAATWGLVGELVTAGDLAERTRVLAMQIADQAPVAVQVAKQLIDGQRARPAVALEALGGGLTAFTTDAAEGRASFRERRRPVYGGS